VVVVAAWRGAPQGALSQKKPKKRPFFFAFGGKIGASNRFPSDFLNCDYNALN
jgi:hypothetical protein